MNRKAKGDVSEAAILTHLLKSGKSVSIPWGDNQPYDLIVDNGDMLLRVQCKTGWIDAGAIVFKTCSNYRTVEGYTSVHYEDRVDMYAVYCPELDKVYLIPAKDIDCKYSTRLRLDQRRNNNQYDQRLAADYELK
jgi:hypothetical protein